MEIIGILERLCLNDHAYLKQTLEHLQQGRRDIDAAIFDWCDRLIHATSVVCFLGPDVPEDCEHPNYVLFRSRVLAVLATYYVDVKEIGWMHTDGRILYSRSYARQCVEQVEMHLKTLLKILNVSDCVYVY